MKKTMNRVYYILRKLGIDRKSIITNLNLKNDIGLSSLDLVVLTNQLEFAFNISIPDEDIQRLNNFTGIVNYLQVNYPTLR